MAPAAGITLLLILLAVPAWEAAHGVWPGRGIGGATWEEVRDGSLAARVDAGLQEMAVTPPLLRPRYNEALYLLFRTVTPRVVLGGDGWMFQRETVHDYPPEGRWESTRRNARAVGAIVAWLRELGTEVELVVVPNKASMMPAQVPAMHPPFSPVYDDALDLLREAGVEPMEIRQLLRDGEEIRYYRTDTHWTPAAAVAVAARVCDGLRDRFGTGGPPGIPVDGEVRPFETIDLAGISLMMIDFVHEGRLQNSLREETTSLVGFDRASGLRIDERRPQPLVLAGTSFSEGFHMASLLSAHCGRRVEDRAGGGHGPVLPLARIMRQILRGERVPPRVIIWELVERMLVLNQQPFHGALENLLLAARYHPRRLLPDALGRRVDVEVEVSPGDAAGELHLTARSRRGHVRFGLAPTLPGDGSHAFALDVATAERGRLRITVVGVDGGRRRHSLALLGYDLPQLLLVPLELPGNERIRRVLVRPAFRDRPRVTVWPPEIWVAP